MSDSTDDLNNEADLIQSDPLETITDSNPEDAGDADYYNTEVDEAEAETHGDTAYVQTYPILEQIIKYFPNASHVYVTSTTGGSHATNSYHYRHEAIDVGSASQSYKDQLAAWLYTYSSRITELIHSRAGNGSGWYVKNGKRVSHGYYGSKTTAAHVNHVHFAIASVSQANALLAAVKAAHGGSAPSHPTLSKGATGSAVRTLQAKLHITVDGDFGAKTEAAVKAFQKAHGLTVDGKVGPNTWAKLG